MSDKMKRWQKNAKDTYKDLKDIDPDKATKQQFILYAACIALQGHKDCQGESTHPTPETAAQGENEGGGSEILHHINDELSDANTYYDLWAKTKEPAYKQFSSDEVRHAEFWFNMARQKGIPQSELQNAITLHGALMAKLS